MDNESDGILRGTPIETEKYRAIMHFQARFGKSVCEF